MRLMLFPFGITRQDGSVHEKTVACSCCRRYKGLFTTNYFCGNIIRKSVYSIYSKVNLCELQAIVGATIGWPPRGNAGQRRAGRHIGPSLLFLFGIDRAVLFTKDSCV